MPEARPAGELISTSTPAGRMLPFALLVAMAAIITLLRRHTLTEPLELDMSVYAVIGHGLLNGERLYADLWDHKPPGIHLLFAAAELIAGYGMKQILLLNLAAAFATLLGVYQAAKNLGASAACGLVAAALWTAVSGNLQIQANQPNTEVFLNALAVWSLVAATGSGSAFRRVLIIGMLTAAASALKQIAVITGFMIALPTIISALRSTPAMRWGIALAAALGGPTILLWCAILAWFATRGTFGEFWECVVVYNREYAGSMLRNLWGITQPEAWRSVPGHIALLLAMATAAALALLRQRPDARSLTIGAYLVGQALCIAMPGKAFPHYAQLWLPPACVGASVLLWMAFRQTTLARVKWLLPAASTILLVAIGAAESRYYRIPADGWSIAKYGPTFVQCRNLGTHLQRTLGPETTIFSLGPVATTTFHAQGRAVGPLVYLMPLASPALGPDLRQRQMDRLAQTPPDIVVVFPSDWIGPEILNAFTTALTQRGYRPLPESESWPHLVVLARTEAIAQAVASGAPSSPARPQ